MVGPPRGEEPTGKSEFARATSQSRRQKSEARDATTICVPGSGLS
jgi:hypothetical protein